MNTWVISDTHFGHENIITYCKRPFKNADHMDQIMIERWQERVRPEDIIYHLGDVGLTKGDYLEKKIMPRLPGKKILVLGNHDKSAKRMMEMGFDFACENMMIQHFNHLLYLVHRPQSLHRGDYILHGHIHNSTPEDRAKFVKEGELVHIPIWNINLSVEMINYEPVTLDWVVKRKVAEERQQMKAFS